jgi:hypothetical protein
MRRIVPVLFLIALGLGAALLYPAPRALAQGVLTLVVEKPGNPEPTHVLVEGGSDGTTTRRRLVDSSGRTIAVGSAADGAAIAGNPVLGAGLGFNGVASVPRYCDKTIAFTTLGTTATVQQIPLVASQQIYICGWQLFASTATTGVDLTWKEGTGTNCATGSGATIGGKFITTPTAATTTPNSTFGPSGPAVRMTITAGEALCITQSSATNSTTLAGTIFYTQN